MRSKENFLELPSLAKRWYLDEIYTNCKFHPCENCAYFKQYVSQGSMYLIGSCNKGLEATQHEIADKYCEDYVKTYDTPPLDLCADYERKM